MHLKTDIKFFFSISEHVTIIIKEVFGILNVNTSVNPKVNFQLIIFYCDNYTDPIHKFAKLQ